MALFSKPLPKKPSTGSDPARLGKRPPQGTADGAHKAHADSPTGGITITGFGAVDWSPTRRKIEVTQGNAGMCAALENAVLLYASGHADQALSLLTKAVQDDDEARQSELAWLALFDLLQRTGDHVAFEQLALRYVVQFEHSAPSWDARQRTLPDSRPAAGGGYIAFSGKLTASASAPLDALRRAIARNASQARFDLAGVSGFDDDGAKVLAQVLAEARRVRYPLRVQRPEKLRRTVEAAVTKGLEGGEGAWLLSLELMQWANDRNAFDDRAIEYAVAFEVSPPSWELPEMHNADAELATGAAASLAAADEAEAAGLAPGSQMLEWSGVLVGPHAPQIAMMSEFAITHPTVPIDMSAVDRVDFVCAGALLNAINAVEAQQKTVQMFGATPIIRGMLLLIGVAPGHFVKKSH